MGTGGHFSYEKLKEREGFVSYRFAGKGVEKAFLPEAGGHRWQSESKGRTHSSTVTVAVLPEPKAAELKLPSKDLSYETYCDSGPGGQNKNKNATAVRVTHVPTGVQACSTMKSLARNKDLALSTLRARLSERRRAGIAKQRNNDRQQQVGTGMRSDKVRTVAEQRGRVENHSNGKRMKIRRYLRGYLEELH